VAYLPGAWRLSDGSCSVVAAANVNPRGLLRVELGGTRMDATVIAAAESRHVFANGRAWQLAAVDPLHHAGEGGGAEGGLMAPMPGKVIALVAVGTPRSRRARRC
jgi:3-methylcrotonyl-CoA carboxylase alpha subunit